MYCTKAVQKAVVAVWACAEEAELRYSNKNRDEQPTHVLSRQEERNQSRILSDNF